MAHPLLLLALVFLFPLTAFSEPNERKLVVIVHPESPVEELSLPDLRRIYRAERKHWADGKHVVLVMREAYSRERDLFLDKVYRMDEIRYRRFWLEKVFRGEADRPQTAMSGESMKEIVSRQKDAIGYLWEDQADASVKIVSIDGQKALASGKEGPPSRSGE